VPQEHGIVLCIHGEVVDPSVDFFEREQLFIADKLEPILEQVPNLKVVLEHATTKEAVAFVENSTHPGGIGCTITPQHMLYNRNALFNKGLNPHFFCLPILKREDDRLELLRGNKTTSFSRHFTTENRTFAKTGSGQTY
jgi:dihydroorotase